MPGKETIELKKLDKTTSIRNNIRGVKCIAIEKGSNISYLALDENEYKHKTPKKRPCLFFLVLP